MFLTEDKWKESFEKLNEASYRQKLVWNPQRQRWRSSFWYSISVDTKEHGRFNTKRGTSPAMLGLNEIASAVDRIDAFGWGLCGRGFLSFLSSREYTRETKGVGKQGGSR
ncbi:hypothetical protein NPIL_208221 [Nephila pilipes]|uniref:Uncharacterized protein n=1 Tax=Nephila pilipes TaxID=299642 RepID=A0A8X6TIS6_NEPPI|nr:hypothetical protein NPIL_208221 [Nephila pilipes]